MVSYKLNLRHLDRSVIEAERVGAPVRFKDYAKTVRNAALMRMSDRHFAEVLQSHGVQAFDDRDVARICLITGAVERMEPLRRLRIFQTVSSAENREMATELEAFLRLNKLRGQMLVVSAGHTALRNYRDRHELLGRAISRLAEPLRERFGQVVQFANTENTYRRKKGRAGRDALRLNLHSHIILTGPRLERPKYEEMKLYIREFMKSYGLKGYCHLSALRLGKPGDEKDRGTITEALKYSFAPDKAMKGSPLTDREIVALYHATRGLKFYRPQGGFLKFRRELQPSTWVEPFYETSPLTGEVRLDPFGEPLRFWRTVRQPGKKVIRRKDEVTGEVTFVTIDRDTRVAVTQDRNDSGCDTDIVLGLQLPSPWAGERMTPSLIVTRYGGDLKALVHKRRLLDRVDGLRRLWNARVAADGRPDLVVQLIGAQPAPRPPVPPAAQPPLRHQGHKTLNCGAPPLVGLPPAAAGPLPAPP